MGQELKAEHPVNTKALAAMCAGAALFGFGYLSGGARAAKNIEDTLPQCQEDEVWYPEDFTGNESVEDLTCIHIEEFAP